MTKNVLTHGNFTGLAEKYSSYRPGYSNTVLIAVSSLLGKQIKECSIADIGAGTGIWTRMLASLQPLKLTAVEPNDDMRGHGIKDSKEYNISWHYGKGEETGLENESQDMVTMASSFHWVNFENGIKEFHRILKEQGRFVAIWNPRLIEANPILKEVEDFLYILKPDLKRVSSGRSGLVENLTSMLYGSELFTDVIYIEGRHSVKISPQAYIETWRSVNDVQFQLGSAKFEVFLQHLSEKLINQNEIEVTYLTRAWSAQKI